MLSNFILLLVCVLMIIACTTIPNPSSSPIPPPIQEIISPIATQPTTTFTEVQISYDTLIPILDSLFITHNGRHWGVIDSSGKEIIPFVHDGVANHQTKSGLGIASIYQSSQSLNTGLPRFSYQGKLVYFNANGYLKKPGEKFSMTVVAMSDFYRPQLVLGLGPSFFLPEGEHLNKNY